MMKIIRKCNSAVRDSGVRSFYPGFSLPAKYLILFLISWAFCSANALAQTTLVHDGIVSGDLTVGDIDSFVFTASAGDAVHIRVVSDDIDPEVWLYNPDGTLNKHTWSFTTTAINCRATSNFCQLDQTGTYRIVVGDRDQVDAGVYDIHFDGPPQQLEPFSPQFEWSLKLASETDLPTVTQDYSCGSCFVDGQHHTGLDLVPTTSDVGIYASKAGTIVSNMTETECTTGDKDCNHGFGNTIIIEHGDSGYFSQYSHLKPGSVQKTSGTVTTGEKIAEMGETGNVSGPHLHFELKNHGGLTDSTGTFFGYTNTHPVNYGYYDPWAYFSSTSISPVGIEINNVDGVNVRRGPGTNYSVLTEINNNNRFVAFAKVIQPNGDTWFRIHLPCKDARTCAGWVAGNYLGTNYSVVVPEATQVEVVNTGVKGLDVQVNPGGAILDTTFDSQRFVTLNSVPSSNGCTTNWYEIFTPASSLTATGWVCGDFVQSSSAQQPDDCTLDTDGNGSLDALTDGLLSIRYIFGIRGESLMNGAKANNCTRCSASEIETFLEQCSDSGRLDIDGNGTVDALTDGLLIIRYLFGIRDEFLINGAVGDGCSRCSIVEIENYLQQ